jgi:penicillin-binding protein 1C
MRSRALAFLERWRLLPLLLLTPIVVLIAVASFRRPPDELRRNPQSPASGRAWSPSVRFVDREGALLREVRADDATRASWAALDEVGPVVPLAILAAEDRRFYFHGGVDPVAVVRAAVDDALERRVVSGASTLTMQLARLVRPHPRTALGKLDEMTLALAIEAELPKRRILEEYMNRAPFGAGLRGIDSASHYYFDKAPSELSLAEAAALAAIPRGPDVYSMSKHPDRVQRRRDRILDRMRAAAFIDVDAWERAKAEPLQVRLRPGTFGAPHLTDALYQGRLVPALGPLRGRASLVTTTLARDLQGEIEATTLATVRPLAERHVTAASVVVIDNATGEVLAYVGSPSWADAANGGQNDGVRALRQPGSTLKPFVYGLAIEDLGWTAATVVPDVELDVALPTGSFAPKNYDERFHGPVRLREALGSSYNVPAVRAAVELSVPRLLDRLHAVGLGSLDRAPEYYGPALALGDGEVTLLALTNAYAAIARGGTWRPVRFVKDVRGVAGDPLVDARGEDLAAERASKRVMTRESAAVIADVLADKNARLASFGERSVLELGFEVAAKTGTSKGFRDNWTIGFTREVTVGVWVGNFDGSAMDSVSGITGAGPLFRSAMEAAQRWRLRGATPGALAIAATDEAFASVEVCPLSGMRPGPSCKHALREWLPKAQHAPHEPRKLATCTMHESVRVDTRNGLRAGPSCPPAFTETREVEVFGPELAAWARGARRGRSPELFSPLCPGSGDGVASGRLRVGYPNEGAEFVLDPDRPARLQSLSVRVEAPRGVQEVRLRVDGALVAKVPAPYVAVWPITRGEHVLVAEATGLQPSEPVRVTVQ